MLTFLLYLILAVVCSMIAILVIIYGLSVLFIVGKEKILKLSKKIYKSYRELRKGRSISG